MPIVILVISLTLVFAGLNDKLGTLSSLLQDDIKPSDGSASFGLWVLAIIIVGVLGYVNKLRPFSNAFLVLIFVAILISNKGFFTQLFSSFGVGTNSKSNTISV